MRAERRGGDETTPMFPHQNHLPSLQKLIPLKAKIKIYIQFENLSRRINLKTLLSRFYKKTTTRSNTMNKMFKLLHICMAVIKVLIK